MIIDTPPLKTGSGKELCDFHDKVKQHLRALKATGKEPSNHFITSMLELKLDAETMFEWQRNSQDSTEIPDYDNLLDFLNLRAQASEMHNPKKTHGYPQERKVPSKPVGAFHANVSNTSNCVVCKDNKHPLYVCPRFKAYNHEQMLATLKEHNLCMNCLGTGHFVRQCKSSHRCRKCNKLHHTLLHVQEPNAHVANPPTGTIPAGNVPPSTCSTQTGTSSTQRTPVTGMAASALSSGSLLMTCRVTIEAPDGSSIEARAYSTVDHLLRSSLRD